MEELIHPRLLLSAVERRTDRPAFIDDDGTEELLADHVDPPGARPDDDRYGPQPPELRPRETRERVPRPETTVTESEIIAHVREAIAGYKVPKSVEIRSEPLPLFGAMKVLKRELREPYWAGHERRVD